jgi:hypothetical protein
MNCRATRLLVWCCLLEAITSPPAACRAADVDHAQPPVRADRGSGTTASPPAAADEAAQREEKFRRLVTNVKLTGHFTMDGEPNGKPQAEEYVITGATKLGNGDAWALTSRIRYGRVDLTVPVPVQVKWAGDTPVITLDKVGVPGLGTFSARVVLDAGRYAGTWSHDDVGGHLFGRIAPLADEQKPGPASPAPATEAPPKRSPPEQP